MSQNNEMADVQLKIKGNLNFLLLSNSETAEYTSSGIHLQCSPPTLDCLLLHLMMVKCKIQEVLGTGPLPFTFKILNEHFCSLTPV